MCMARKLFLNLYLFILCTIAFSQDTQLFKTHHSPFAVMQSARVGDVKWTEGFWADLLEVCHTTMVPHMWELFTNPEYSQAYNNFKVAAGLMEGRHRGAKFNDGDFYKWMEAAAYIYADTHDESLNQILDEIIQVIAKAQRKDGYIHTPVIIEQRNGQQTQEWNDQLHFETYNMGHLMTTASVHYQVTGKTSLLDVAIHAAHYLKTVSQTTPKELANATICPSHYMGIIDLYRLTHDVEYLDVAKRLIDIRSMTDHGTDHNQDRIPFREQTEARGHAVRANYLYAGVTDVYLETGGPSLLPALESIWQDVVTRKMYITGSTGALYDGASPDGSSDHSSIQLVHQAYGRSYQLPNITAYNETCATIGNGLWNWRMLRTTGESRFADVLELSLYNGILSGISLEGKHYFYTNPLRVDADLPIPLRWSRERQDYYGSFCCPPNVVRVIAGISQYAYGISERCVWINLYGSNEFKTNLPGNTSVHLKQTSNYPWDGNIKIEILSDAADEFELKFRIPDWADQAEIFINGNRISDHVTLHSYYSIKRNWQPHDTIILNLPMKVKLMEANPLVEELRNQTAVKRGPVIYCLESKDMSDFTKVSDVFIPKDITFVPKHEPKLLHGVTVLEGNANIQPPKKWENTLYQERKQTTIQSINIRMIPYFSWGNRGKSEMTVWLPIQ